MKKNRIEKINEVLNYLESINNTNPAIQYSIDENKLFFSSIKQRSDFFKWLQNHVPTIKRNEILEFNDFCDKRFNQEFIVSLSRLEKRIFPGLVNPMVKRVFKVINKENISSILNWGSGNMEIERQIIEKLIKRKNKKSITFIGIDRSDITYQATVLNFKKLEPFVDIRQVDFIDSIYTYKSDSKKPYTLLLCKTDIFALKENLEKIKVDLFISSLFMHHLDEMQKDELYKIETKLSDRIIEYDGYQSKMVLIQQALWTWRKPLLLNGTVFSNLRYAEKLVLRNVSDFWKIKFYSRGTYLKEFNRLK